MWGELASRKRLFNPPPQFSRLGTRDLLPCCLVWCCMFCVFVILVCDRGGRIPFCLSQLLFLAGMLYTIILNNYF